MEEAQRKRQQPSMEAPMTGLMILVRVLPVSFACRMVPHCQFAGFHPSNTCSPSIQPLGYIICQEMASCKCLKCPEWLIKDIFVCFLSFCSPLKRVKIIAKCLYIDFSFVGVTDIILTFYYQNFELENNHPFLIDFLRFNSKLILVFKKNDLQL